MLFKNTSKERYISFGILHFALIFALALTCGLASICYAQTTNSGEEQPLESQVVPEKPAQLNSQEASKSGVETDDSNDVSDGEVSDADAGQTESDQSDRKNIKKKGPDLENNQPVAPSKKKTRKRKVVEYEDEDFLTRVQEWFLSTGLQIALIAALAMVALKFSSIFSNNAFSFFTRNKEGTELKRRADTLSSVVRYTLAVSILAISGMMVLKELGIDIGPILAGAGVVGLAVGFGAQNLVKDVISGFFILLEDQIRVGDVVKVGDKGGLVEKVTLRMVVLRDISHNVHYIPNSEIHIVTNMTQIYSGYLFDVGVAYREDVDAVIDVMRQIDEEMRSDPLFESRILEPLEVMGLEKFADSAVIVRARTKTLPLQQWSVGREFNKRLKKRFDELGIEIPFPHVTVYPGEYKDGIAPDFNIKLQQQKVDVGNSGKN